jgi:toxin FitB
MMCLLDTNVVSELRKIRAGEAHPSVDAAELFVSAITIMALELGVLLMERKDAIRGVMLRSWLEQHVLPAFANRTVSVDISVALRCARLHLPH